jgi:acetate---CoA ligase (ADP-forming)
LNQDKLKEFEPIFSPKSIAVVGASANQPKAGTVYVQALISGGYKGKLYPVTSSGGQVLGLKAYKKISDIPGDVEFVIVSVPAQAVLELIDDCAVKGVKVVQLFTAGFLELGDEGGRRLEQQLVARARQRGIRVIGPNCLGISHPAIGTPLGPSLNIAKPGAVGIISQSGGHATKLITQGLVRGIGFSKAISLGNACDLDIADFTEYLAADPETKVIGAYIEGIKDGQRWLKVAAETARLKPLVIWKGGSTQAGAKAAGSHTGSLASTDAIWTAAIKQAGAVRVDNGDEWADVLLAFQHLPNYKGGGVAIAAGITDGGGGDSVLAADSFLSVGLPVPDLTQKTLAGLGEFLPRAGSILSNPMDVSQAQGLVEIQERAYRLVLADPGIELFVIVAYVDEITHVLPAGSLEKMIELWKRLKAEQPKPLVIVLPSGLAEPERLKAQLQLSRTGIPVFPGLPRAAQTLAKIAGYYRGQSKTK